MIDTKRVELSPYKQIGEKCEVATSFERGVQILKEVCYQIDARYELMEKFGYRTMPNNLYRVIVVIEELSDLMMASKKAVEKHIVKIAQLGRACGVHLIIATQRPTVDVVTGQIKANIGCRFALKTTSAIDSRNILDKSGAEKLSGKGDCLLKLPETTDEIHLQCPYISDKDIEKTIKNYSGRN
ncbi:MAG: DNA translocase FtsK [Acetobacter sp.]|nr:DNA translocase FtsK [Acetobacter sp.]